MVKYFAGDWTVQELAAIEQELERQGVQYTIDGDELLVHDDHQERRVDMIVESITEKIVVGKDEIDITLCYLPVCKDMANGWRKGEDSNLR